MEENVDAGRILKVARFPVLPDDTCESLDFRARRHALILMQDIMDKCSQEEDVWECNENWSGTTMTREKFGKWMTLSLHATEEETGRKIRALRHSTLAGPYVLFHGYKFGYRCEK